MKRSHSVRRTITSSVLMFVGVFFMDPNNIIHRMFGSFFTDHLFQLFIGITFIVIGFIVFTKTLELPKRKNKERTYQKSKHEFIEIFGLE